MEIKRTGPGRPPFDSAAEPVEGKKKRVHEPVHAGAPESPAPVGVEFAEADLRDPARIDALVNRYMGELVDSASRRMDLPLLESDRKVLLEHLSSDPVMRARLVDYLDQRLKESK